MVSSPTSPAFSSSYASSFRPSHQHIAIPTIVITPSCDASEKLDSYPFPLDTLEYASPPSVPLSGSSEKGGSATIVTGGGGGGGGRYGEKGRSGSRVHRAFVVVFGLLMMALLMGSWLDGSGGVSLASLGLIKGRSAVGGVVEEEPFIPPFDHNSHHHHHLEHLNPQHHRAASEGSSAFSRKGQRSELDKLD